jgi:hypothetical protein
MRAVGEVGVLVDKASPNFFILSLAIALGVRRRRSPAQSGHRKTSNSPLKLRVLCASVVVYLLRVLPSSPRPPPGVASQLLKGMRF